MGFQSESELENELIEQLVSEGYQWVPEVKSEATMIANFRTILETRNSSNIGDEPLTDKEFERLMTQINGNGFLDSDKNLPDKVLLKRNNGKNLYLELLNTKDWCKNTFQFTNQISWDRKNANPCGVTILINGLPLMKVELNQSGVDITEEGLILAKEHKKMKKEIGILRQTIQTFESTGDNKNLLQLSKRYQCDRKRVRKEILCGYGDLFATIENIRELSILGVQNVDLSVKKNEVDFRECIKRYQALKPMMIKYRDVFDEIICLVENGFTDGAMQRWRTFYEYSVIIMFILQQGETVAEAYFNSLIESVKDDLKPRTNFAWAKTADCLKKEKQINLKMLLENLQGVDTKNINPSLDFYKLTSQSIHGSALGINMSFNDYMSDEINDLHTKHADYYSGGVSTVISHTMNLLMVTYLMYFSRFPDGGLNIENLWSSLIKEYVKVFEAAF